MTSAGCSSRRKAGPRTGRHSWSTGARPTQEDDEGIWSLAATGDGTTESWIVVNAQRRYLLDPTGHLKGAERDDALAAELAAGSIDELANAIRRAQPSPPGQPQADGW